MRKPLTNSPKLLSFPHFLAEAGRERYRQPWLAGPPAANCEPEITNNENDLFAQDIFLEALAIILGKS